MTWKIYAAVILAAFIMSNLTTWKVTSGYYQSQKKIQEAEDKVKVAEDFSTKVDHSENQVKKTKAEIKIVKVKGDDLIREVPIYVKESCEPDGTLSDSWRVLHDKGTEVQYTSDSE